MAIKPMLRVEVGAYRFAQQTNFRLPITEIEEATGLGYVRLLGDDFARLRCPRGTFVTAGISSFMMQLRLPENTTNLSYRSQNVIET